MLTVNTKAYGTIEVDERQKIHFPYGIFGFEAFKDFILLVLFLAYSFTSNQSKSSKSEVKESIRE